MLEVRSLTTRYPSVVANDRVSLTLSKGEVLGLLGENGAGKTSLVKALAGLVKPDEGEILLDGTATRVESPLVARRLGIQMVHQHFSLCPQLTVIENVLLARGVALGRLRADAAKAKLADLSEQYGLAVDHSRLVSTLTVGERQIVEILKALSNDPKVLILDEPTAVLSAPETHALYGVIERLRTQGCGVVLITHKLEELLRATDRIAVMRLGRVVEVFETASADVNVLAVAMMGGEQVHRDPVVGVEAAEVGLLDVTQAEQPPEPRPGAAEHLALELEGLSADGSAGHHAVYDVDLSVGCGEIVGVAGIEGNGQSALVEAIVGLAKIRRGRISISGREVTRRSAPERLASEVAVIPEDRHHQAVVPHMTVTENLALALAGRQGFSRHGVLRWGKLRQQVNQLIGEYGVKAAAANRFETLSGGNQQRLVLARELAKRPAVLVAAHPTRGLDIGGAAYVHKQLRSVAAGGTGVLLVSSDLDEILLLAHRVVVMHRGRVVATVSRDEATRERIGLWMIGVHDESEMSA